MTQANLNTVQINATVEENTIQATLTKPQITANIHAGPKGDDGDGEQQTINAAELIAAFEQELAS